MRRETRASDAGLPDETIEAMVTAKVLKSQSELSDALPEEKNKFNMINRWFPENQLPEAFSDDTVRTLLKFNSEFKFMRYALGINDFSVCQWVIDNLTNTMRANLSDASKLLTSLGFTDFSHLLKWCSAAASKKGRPSKDVQVTRRLGKFEFDEELVSGAQQRLGLAFDEKNKPVKPVVKTVRCLVAIIKKHCPLLGTREKSKRTIHDAQTECFFTTDEEFIKFFYAVIEW